METTASSIPSGGATGFEDLPQVALEALATRINAEVERRRELARREHRIEPERLTFLDARGYAEHVGVSEWKVRELCKLGLPHSRLPGGRRLIRIHVTAADAWLKAQGGRQ